MRRARTAIFAWAPLVWAATATVALLLASQPVTLHAQKYGGTLKAVQRENPPSLLIPEWATISASWPVMPVYNNLVFYNPDNPVESADDLVGELAEKWEWSNGGKKLTFHLRHGVTWHDGKPFTAADVKYTYDVVRGADPVHKLRTSPRKLWYDNVLEIQTPSDYEVVFVLKRSQPALLSMLSSGYSPVLPAHVDLAALRTTAVGTGPFMLKEYLQDQRIELVKNPHYFIKGRPYLDGITYAIIKDRQARAAAMIAHDVEVFFPQEGTTGIVSQVQAGFPQVVVKKLGQNGSYNITVNTKKPPFDNLKLRQAVNYAMDRSSFLKAEQGNAAEGGVLLSPPFSKWGLTHEQLIKLPGWGDGVKDKAMARKLLAEEGYGPDHPLKVVVSTRSVPLYTDMAVWVVDQLHQVGIEGSLEEVESAQWFGKLQRGEYQLAANMVGQGADDPDSNFFENYTCGSPRNYSFYCSKDVEALMVKESEELNPAKRLALVREVDERLQIEVARSMLGQALDYVMYAPWVKGYTPHNNIYNYGRMQNVWLDR